jgi:hypothetical protein
MGGVIRAANVKRIEQPAFVTDAATAPGAGLSVVPIVGAGRIEGLEVRCRCGEHVLIECVYDQAPQERPCA